MELCGCTSSCCVSKDDESDSNCDESCELSLCTCTNNKSLRKVKSETIVTIEKVLSKDNHCARKSKEYCNKNKNELEFAKNLLRNVLRKTKCINKETRRQVNNDDCGSIKIVFKNSNCNHDCTYELTNKTKYKPCKESNSSNSPITENDSNCCVASHRETSSLNGENTKHEKITCSKHKFKLHHNCHATNKKSTSVENVRKWCRNNARVNFNLEHDRRLEFENPFNRENCPDFEVHVTGMKKFKDMLKGLYLYDSKFNAIPGIGSIYNLRIQKQFKNVLELLETANIMKKEDFKALLKCYANVSCYYGEMIYNSCIEYIKQKNLCFN